MNYFYVNLGCYVLWDELVNKICDFLVYMWVMDFNEVEFLDIIFVL